MLINRIIRLTLLLLLAFSTLSSTIRLGYCTYEFYIVPGYENGYAIPVNIETELYITVYSYITGKPVSNVPVTITPQWTAPMEKYSGSDGKVFFKVKPTSKGNFTITYSSRSETPYFATLVTYVSAKPAVMIEATYDNTQYMDPIGNEDIVIYIKALSSEDYTIVSSPLWDVTYKCENVPVTPNIVHRIEIYADKYKLILSINPRSSSTQGNYYITVRGYSSQLLPVPYTYKVFLRIPAIFTHYKFATGEEITIGPHQTGTGINVKRECPYFDVYFVDAKGHPLTVSFVYGSDMFVIEGQAGGRYTIRENDFTYEWYTDNTKSEGSGNRLRIYFTLTEIYYSTIQPFVQTGIGGYLTSTLDQPVVLRVATIRTGFNIWDFITNPYIMVPLTFIVILILARLVSRGKKKE